MSDAARSLSILQKYKGPNKLMGERNLFERFEIKLLAKKDKHKKQNNNLVFFVFAILPTFYYYLLGPTLIFFCDLLAYQKRRKQTGLINSWKRHYLSRIIDQMGRTKWHGTRIKLFSPV